MSWINDAEVRTATELDQDRMAGLISWLEARRKEVEAEGVVVNGVRYAGNPENRQALLEVVQHAREAGVTQLSVWKDSDNQFHYSHPLADVEQALQAIASRRSTLITLESQYVERVSQGALTDVSQLDWTV